MPFFPTNYLPIYTGRIGGSSPDDRGSFSVGDTPYRVFDPAEGESFNTVLQQLLGETQRQRDLASAVPSFQDLLAQGINSPLMQQVLGPALEQLIPGYERALQGVEDQFRSAGALGGSAHGRALDLTNESYGQQQNALVSGLIPELLGLSVSGLGQQFNQQMAAATAPGGLLASILGQTRPEILAGSTSSSGGSRGGGGGGISSAGSAFAPFRENPAPSYSINRAPTPPNYGYQGLDISVPDYGFDYSGMEDLQSDDSGYYGFFPDDEYY